MDSSILIVLAILAVTVFMLVLDVVRIDVVAILSMLALAWSGVLEPRGKAEKNSGKAQGKVGEAKKNLGK